MGMPNSHMQMAMEVEFSSNLQRRSAGFTDEAPRSHKTLQVEPAGERLLIPPVCLAPSWTSMIQRICSIKQGQHGARCMSTSFNMPGRADWR